ncbi:MAG: hypothetical protein H7248_11320 [Microbacteriaceae bacterium]|nr:hypothetical protein [Microbacteriaceae bacterium]
MSIGVSPSAPAGAGAGAVLAAIHELPRGRPSVVLIDGRSGAGKSTLATTLHEQWPEAQLLRLEDFYPGWNGLEAASAQLHRVVLRPFSIGRSARWQSWDWITDGPGEWRHFDAAAPLLIEGCGALSRANRALAQLGVWVELATAERFHRASFRDAGRFETRWASWAAQEEAFAARERPSELADLIVSG